MMRCYDYWKKREEEQRKHNITEEKEYSRELQTIYKNMMDECQHDIDSFYAKYAGKYGISMAEAKKSASKLDIEEYSRKAKKYVKDRDFSKQANDEMKLYNMTMKVNRLELLKANLGLELVKGHNQIYQFFYRILYKRSMDEFKRQSGILGRTVVSNGKLADSIVNASFHNATFSDRIWMHQDLLKSDLNKLLQVGLIQGKNPRVLAAEIRKRFNVKASDAERLMRTEMARVQIEAQKKSYEKNGIEEYEFIALGNACDICKAIDGKHFKTEKMMPGDNAPPMHPNCRCSTAPYIDRREYDEWLNYLDKGGTTKEWNKLQTKKKGKKFNSNDDWFPFKTNSSKISAVINSDKVINEIMSKLEIDKELTDIVSSEFEIIPKNDLQLLVKNKIKLLSSLDYSYYDSINGHIMINKKDFKKGIIAHELGHIAVDINSLYKNKKLESLMKNVLAESRIKVMKRRNRYFIELQSDKFVRPYQGHTYIDITDKVNSIKKGEKLKIDKSIVKYTDLEEYISVGYETFVCDPQLLYDKDIDLYNFIKGGGLSG